MNETTEFPHVMLDLETLGTDPGAPILSVGAVFYDLDTGQLGAGMKVNIDLEQSLLFGFKPSASTIQWWMRQPRETWDMAREAATQLPSALMAFADFLTEDEGGVNETIKIWGNGAAFDNVLLREAYRKCNMLEPWRFWNDRCFRTVKGECANRNALQPPFEGTVHDALADAMHQARWHINIHKGFLFHNSAGDEKQLDLLTGPNNGEGS